MEIGKVIHHLIKKRGLTQLEVANKIGKSTTALSQIVNGNYNPNPDTLKKICDVLEVPVPVVYFLSMSEEEVPEEKLELYKMLAPTIKEFIYKIFGEDSLELQSDLK